MHDLVEGMAIAFSLLMILGVVGSFIGFMWIIGRKEKAVLEAYDLLEQEEQNYE